MFILVKLRHRDYTPQHQMIGDVVRVDPHIHMQGDLEMNKAIIVKLAAAAAVVGLAGCTDLKPLQAEVDTLKTQVSKLQSDVSGLQATQSSQGAAISKAQSDASSAASTASAAQGTANQALSAAQAAQASVDATNEKIDRMFKKSVSK